MGWEETPLIVLASVSLLDTCYVVVGKDFVMLTMTAQGFILGEGFFNVVNLVMESIKVPHL